MTTIDKNEAALSAHEAVCAEQADTNSSFYFLLTNVNAIKWKNRG